MRFRRSILIALAITATLTLVALAQPRHGPSIEGSYILDYRELPDGSKVRAPDIHGMITFTHDRRNFNVYWTENGRPVSISIISKYTLTADEFTEESLYYMANGVAGKGIEYKTKPIKGSSPVTMDATTGGGQIAFQLPLHDEPKVVFDGRTMIATREGAFVDHWKKVE